MGFYVKLLFPTVMRKANCEVNINMSISVQDKIHQMRKQAEQLVIRLRNCAYPRLRVNISLSIYVLILVVGGCGI